MPALHLRTVLEARTKSKRRLALSNLAPNLDDAFGSTIERVKGQARDSVDQALRVLTLIHLAERPLTVDELLHALATEMNHRELDCDNFPSRNSFLDCCLGLVIVDNETLTLRLVHYTLHEYLSTQSQLVQHGHESITQICLTYLMFRHPESNIKAKAPGATTTSTPALFNYAACEWGHHARKGYPLKQQTVCLILEYLSMDPWKRQSSVRCLIGRRRLLWSLDALILSFSSLHIIAYFGINQVLLDVIAIFPGANPKDNNSRTPLSWAAEAGHEAVVKLLLTQTDIAADSEDMYFGQTPLSWAAARGHEAVVKLLLDRSDVEVNSKDVLSGKTPLSWATDRGHEAVVKLLLSRRDIEADSKDDMGCTPLWHAAAEGHEAVVRLLLARSDIDVNCKSDEGYTPLWVAAAEGNETVVRLLLARSDVEADSKDNDGRTPLSQAAGQGHMHVVKLLIETGKVVTDSKDKDGRTPLSWAAEPGHRAVVQLLQWHSILL
jgi:ankyrin repeat protein